MKNKYEYEEKQSALDNRINAHAKYSNFNLHDWISSKFMIKEGDHILDLGCGNGNYTKLFFDKVKKDGIIYSIDKNKDLIFDAKIKYSNLSHNINFEVADYDVIENVGLSFDWVFSIYSIYYTADSLNLIMNLKSVMSRTGKFVVIGPAHKNAVDLDLFNTKVTGVQPSPENRLRNKRIETEFYQLFKSIYGEVNVKLEIINSEMNFQTVDAYVKYYWSTLLWRESIKGLSDENVKILKDKTVSLLSQEVPQLKIIKQMSCLIGYNT